MGIHLEFTGKGCRRFKKHLEDEKITWIEFFTQLLHASASFTRLDLAFDDILYLKDSNQELSLNLQRIKEETKAGNFKARSKTYSFVESGTANKSAHSGLTVNIGSRFSSCYIRFYDKKAEQLSKKIKCIDYSEWQRYELELKQEFSHQVAVMISNGEDIGVIARSILIERLMFINPKTQKPRRWWTNFLGNVDAIKLETNPHIQDITSIMNWLEDNVAKSLALVCYVKGFGYAHSLVRTGVLKLETDVLTPFQKQIIVEHKRLLSKGLATIITGVEAIDLDIEFP